MIRTAQKKTFDMCVHAIAVLQAGIDELADIIVGPDTRQVRDGSSLPATAMYPIAVSEYTASVAMLSQTKARVMGATAVVLFGKDDVDGRVKTVKAALSIIVGYKNILCARSF